MRTARVCFILLTLAIAAGPARGEPASRGRGGVAVDLGAYGTNLEQRFSVAKEYQSQVSAISAFFRIRPRLHLGKGIFFEPALGFLVPWRSGADGNTKTFTGHLDLAVHFPLFSFLGIRLGPGLQSVATVSSGEAVTLNNGTSTSTFYTPGRFSNSLLLTVQGGLVINFSQRICLMLETYVPEVANRARRRFHGVATLGYTL